MKNFFRKNIDREARTSGDEVLSGGLVSIMLYAYGLIDADPGMIAGATGFLAIYYAAFSPWLVRRVKIRNPPGDTWGAAAIVAIGAAPFGLFLPFWSGLTTGLAAIIAFPLVVAWSGTAGFLALRRHAPPAPSRQRVSLLAIGAVLYAVVALTFATLCAGMLTGFWIPPDDEYGWAAIGLVVGLPWALMAGYAALELLGQANGADQSMGAGPPDHGPASGIG